MSKRLLIVAGLTLLALPAPVASAHGRRGSLRVMTRNLYVGVDIFRILEAGEDPDPLAVPTAVAEAYQHVLTTNFAERAEAIASEVAKARPHALGLQEVPIYRTQTPGDVLLGNPEEATDVSLDFLEILQSAISAHGLKYEVVAESTNADLELPLLAGVTEEGAPLFDDLRMTDRDVLLVREGVKSSHALSGNFEINAQTTLGGVPIEFRRGYNLADVKVKGREYRIVNTHLEVGGSEPTMSLQSVQMSELLAVVGATSRADVPVVLLGDLNSPPDASDFVSTSGIPGLDGQVLSPPYLQALEAGYLDPWDTSWHASQAFTCCFAEGLVDESVELTERIDHILVHPKGRSVRRLRARLVGERTWDRTDSGLAPSDHAGVVGKIKLGRKL